jgi:hypothetical protein
MYVEPLDNKGECVGFYYDGKIVKELPTNVINSWSYHPMIGNDAEYATLYTNDNEINSYVPQQHKNDWNLLNKKMKAFFNSFGLAKVNLEDNCVFDLIPEHFVIDYYNTKTKIVEHVVTNYNKPNDYDYLVKLSEVIWDIKNRKLNIDTSILENNKLIEKYNSLNPYVNYNIFGTKTGRLSTHKRSFPIMQMNKEHRTILNPNNDWFVELDYNGAEVRTFLALAGKQQPKADIHDWNNEHIFNNSKTRDEAKVSFLAWLYGENKNEKAENIYNKEKVLKQFWNGEKVITFYGKEILADDKHALSYLIQSTFAQLALRQMIKVFEYLKGRKSFIAFTIHDNIVIDLAEEDKKDLKQIMKIYSDTDLGMFKVNVKAGNNYGEMHKI